MSSHVNNSRLFPLPEQAYLPTAWRSSVWRVFYLIQRPHAIMAICGVPTCKTEYFHNGSTSTYRFHILRDHNDVDRDHGLRIQAELDHPLSLTTSEAKEILDLFLKSVVNDNLPFILADSDYFRTFVSKLLPGYSLPSDATISRRLIPEAYQSQLALLIEEVKFIPSGACTSDIWVSNHQQSRSAFMSYTYHSIDPAWQLHSRLLAVPHIISATHTAADIRDTLLPIEKMFHRTGSNTIFVTDRGSNYTSMISQDMRPSESCFGHDVNNAVEDALAHLAPTSTVFKKAVKYFHKSNKSTRIFNDHCEAIYRQTFALLKRNNTRWFGELNMFKRLLKVAGAWNLTLNDLAIKHKKPQVLAWIITNDLLDLFNEIVAALTPLEELVTILSSETRVTSSNVWPLMKSYLKYTLPAIQWRTEDGKKLKEKLHVALSSRFPPQRLLDGVFSLASVCDVNHKNLDFLTTNERKQVHENFLRVLRSHHTVTETTTTTTQTQVVNNIPAIQTTTTSTTTDITPIRAAKRGSDESFYSGIDKNLKRVRINTSVHVADPIFDEFNTYLAIRSPSTMVNPLDWWASNAHVFPCIAKLAAHYLAVPATSTSSERAWSFGESIASIKRNRLDPFTLSCLLFLKFNWN